MLVNGKCMIEGAAIMRFLACALPTLKDYYSQDIWEAQAIDAALDFHSAFIKVKMATRTTVFET